MAMENERLTRGIGVNDIASYNEAGFTQIVMWIMMTY